MFDSPENAPAPQIEVTPGIKINKETGEVTPGFLVYTTAKQERISEAQRQAIHKKFVGGAGDKNYQEGYEAIFGKKETDAEMN